MSRQKALDASGRADLLTLTTALADPSLSVDDGLVSDLLHAAILSKATGIVRYLLSTYPTTKLSSYPEVFIAAASQPDIEILDLLHAKYPDCVSESFEGRGRGTLLGIALAVAAPKAYVEHLLLLGSAPDGGVQEDTTIPPLAFAASQYESSEMVELLLKHGAKIEGSKALAAAARRGSQTNAKYLLDRGADVNDPGTGFYPWLPLHVAVTKGDKEMVRILLAGTNRANLALVDRTGRTAMELAREGGNIEIMSLLKDAEG